MRQLLRSSLLALFAVTLRAEVTPLETLAVNRWGIQNETLLREYILPQTSLGEDCVDWLPILQPIAEEIAHNAQTPFEAATLLNRHLWQRTGVIYSTRRDKANQDPLHSMRIGMASCSGLSILLADACRSLGIPARLVGCQWRLKPGNHTWVEVWSNGQWFPLGAAEDVPPEKLWFLGDAAAADPQNPRYAIYATRATRTPESTTFWGWGVPADNVTTRYLRPTATTPPPGLVRIHIAAERNGHRIALPFTCNGQTYRTPGPLQDLNDYTTLLLPENTDFTLIIDGHAFTHRATPNAIFVERLPETIPAATP